MSAKPVAAPDPWETVSIELRVADLFPCSPSWKIGTEVVERDGLFYIWKGYGWLEHDGKRLDAQPGDLFFTRAGMRVAAGHDPQRPVTVLSTGFMLRGRAGADPLRRIALPQRLRLPPAARRGFAMRFTELVGEFHDPSPAAQLGARGLALRLLAEALRLAEELPADCKAGSFAARPGEAARVTAVLEWIDTRIAEPLELAQLAKIAHLSPVYFATLFRKETGQSPMAYLRDRRIDLARSMLAAGDASVEEVARAVGFADPFHFSRAFRRKTGMSPSAYRASLKSPFQR